MTVVAFVPTLTVAAIVLCTSQAAVDLNEAQQLDLMHLRRLFYCRLGSLLRERKALLSKVGADRKDCFWTGDAASGAAGDIAEQLRANGIAEHRSKAPDKHII